MPPTDACSASNASATTAASESNGSTTSTPRASSLRFGDPRVQSLFAALVAFRLLPQGFANRDLRERVAPLTGLSVDDCHRNRTTHDLRRLRLRGLVRRIPHTRRCQVTDRGIRTALRCHRAYARVMRPTMAVAFDLPHRQATRLGRALDAFDDEVRHLWQGQNLAA